MNPAQPGILKGIKLVAATVALGLGSFMNILDLTIVNVAVPTMAGDFAVTPTQGTWIITSYSVAEAIMLPLAGFLAGRFGEVRSFVAATLLFTLASLLCALSVSFPMLLACARAAGRVRRLHDPAVANAAHHHLSAAPARAGAGHLGHDHGDRADRRSAGGRLADR